MQLISPEVAAEYRGRSTRHDVWALQFKKPNGWIVITPDEQKTCPADAQISNDERGKLEQYEIVSDPPASLFAYVRPDHDRASAVTVTVWTGEPLGYGVWGPVYRDNFGGERRTVRARIGGADYSGFAPVSAGDYCRLRRVKGRAHV